MARIFTDLILAKFNSKVEIRVARKVCEINVNQMYFVNEIGFSVKCYLKVISMIKLAYVKKLWKLKMSNRKQNYFSHQITR